MFSKLNKKTKFPFYGFTKAKIMYYYADLNRPTATTKAFITKKSNEYSISTEKYENLISKDEDKIYRKEIFGYNQAKITTTYIQEFDSNSFVNAFYSIPQDVWCEFTSNLNQDIVKALNLNKHIHLWPAYNYAKEASSKIAMMSRARLIGSYHFLLPAIHCHIEPPSKLRASIRRDYLYNFDVNYEQQLNTSWTQFRFKLLNEDFTPKNMLSIHPVFTTLFLQKVAHCTNYHTIVNLANTIMRYSINDHSLDKANIYSYFNLSQNHLHTAINWLPSSKENPKDFSNMIKFLDSNRVFIFASRGKWNDEKFNMNITMTFDYLNALYDDLIYREIFRKLRQRNITNMTYGSLEHLKLCIKDKFRQYIEHTNSIDKLESLQQRWHRNINGIENEKPINAFNSWKPLIDDIMIDSVTIKSLTDERSLKNHAKELVHCAGGYIGKCMANTSDIFELTDNEGIKSTLEIGKNKQFFYIIQHKALRNSQPNNLHVRVANTLVNDINNNKININPERLKEKKVQAQFSYDINNLEIQESIYKIYKDKQVLPTLFKAKSYHEMLEQSGMNKVIDNVLESFKN